MSSRTRLLLLAGLALGASALVAQSRRAPSARLVVTAVPNTPIRVIARDPASLRLQVGSGTWRGDTLLARTPLYLTASLARGGIAISAERETPIHVDAEFGGRLGGRGSGYGYTVHLREDGGIEAGR
jgi:hypothetical protein